MPQLSPSHPFSSQVRAAFIAEDGQTETKKLAKHNGRAHKLALEADQPQCFLSSGEDGAVLSFDLRTRKCTKLLVCKTPGRLEGVYPVHDSFCTLYHAFHTRCQMYQCLVCVWLMCALNMHNLLLDCQTGEADNDSAHQCLVVILCSRGYSNSRCCKILEMLLKTPAARVVPSCLQDSAHSLCVCACLQQHCEDACTTAPSLQLVNFWKVQGQV